MTASNDPPPHRGAFMDRHIGHLLRRAYVRARKNSADALLEIGDLSPVQASALAALMEGPLSQADIGRRIEMEPANTHTLVRRLTAAGLVSRHADAKDRRLALIALTASGTALAGRLEIALLASSSRTMLALDNDERRQLIVSLKKIVDWQDEP